MKRYSTIFVVFMLILSVGFIFAQDLNYKSGYQFPVEAEDAVLSGLRSVRGVDFHANPLGDNVAAFAATNYYENGFIHVFKNVGNDSLELVWTSPAFDSLGGSTRPRFVKWGDLDNDGIIELIAPFNQNGIAIFEWDGVEGSWNFGDAPAKLIADPLYPTADSLTSYHSVEFLEVEDVDNDGMNELLLANNSTGSDFDRYYIFSINGTYSSGNPGFSTIKREGMWLKSSGEYAAYGGGTPYAMITADLNGDGVKNVLFHNWNYGHISPLRSTGPDTYLLADTTGGHHYVYGNYPDDCVSLGGGTAFDVDGDGREEVFIPLYSANGLVEMVHFPEGHDLSTIDSTNIFMIDMFPGDDDRHDFYGRAGYGDFDQNGKQIYM